MRAFSQVDVFTSEFLLGNPVAVVHDADGLSPTQMAAFARWTNLVETTFLLAASDPRADYLLRIFTPQGELPFAGHPTLGSARAWLEARDGPRQGSIVQQCAVGLIEVRIDGHRLSFAAPPLIHDGAVDDADVERLSVALGLRRNEIVDAQWVDNGPGWVALLLADAAAVLAVEPNRGAFGEFTSVGVVGPYPPGSEAAFEVRAFIPRIGVGEDPVTGSLNGSLAQWLISSGRAPSSYVASQGARLGRRGRVYLEQLDDQIWVGGDTVIGVSGTVAL